MPSITDYNEYNDTFTAPGPREERADAVSDKLLNNGSWTANPLYGGDVRDDRPLYHEGRTRRPREERPRGEPPRRRQRGGPPKNRAQPG